VGNRREPPPPSIASPLRRALRGRLGLERALAGSALVLELLHLFGELGHRLE
jgi:hypothetical protein